MKYREKQPNPEDVQIYTEICINCGKKRSQIWPKELPIPNMTAYWGKPSWFSCHVLRDHYWYSEDELEYNV